MNFNFLILYFFNYKNFNEMKILVLGAGKMGSFFLDLLSFDHETAVYEKDPKRMRFTYNC